jgi:(hydroxyamino)benzene mutase
MTASTRKALLVSGALLFLIGLLSGVLVPQMLNPRMGLSAHLAGVQNALVLLVLAAVWEHVVLSQRLRVSLCWLGIFSMYGFWLALQLAAVWGTSRTTPIAGAGFEGLQWQEEVVTLLLRGSSLVSILAALLLVAGFCTEPLSDSHCLFLRRTESWLGWPRDAPTGHSPPRRQTGAA